MREPSKPNRAALTRGSQGDIPTARSGDQNCRRVLPSWLPTSNAVRRWPTRKDAVDNFIGVTWSKPVCTRFTFLVS